MIKETLKNIKNSGFQRFTRLKNLWTEKTHKVSQNILYPNADDKQ